MKDTCKSKWRIRIYGADHLYLTERLWDKLNAHHSRVCRDFSGYYSARSFAERCVEILSRGREIRLVMLEDDTREKFAYCVSSAERNGAGEIDSLYVDDGRRDTGAGGYLVDDALKWFREMNTRKNVLTVYCGNESAVKFYERKGFYPKYLVCEERGLK